MQTDSVHALYLRDLGFLLRERAQEAVAKTRAEPNDGFSAGRAAAYYEVISLMLSQTVGFGIPADDLALSGVDPERDLIPGVG